MHNRIKLYGQTQMDKKDKFIDAVLKSARREQDSDNRKKLSCAEGFEIAREFDAEIIEIGRICNKHNIRICKCQLGCFR